MKFSTSDVIAKINGKDTDGLSEVSFGGPDDSYFQMCRLSRERCRLDGIAERGVADIYCEVRDQSRSAEGGVIECVLTNTTFLICFDSMASNELKEERIELNLMVSHNVLKQLLDALNCIFRDTRLFTNKTNLQLCER